MGMFDGKCGVITGGARGQGRSHAIALGREGAAVALWDIANGESAHPRFRVADRGDLDETARLVAATAARVLPLECDVREPAQVERAAQQTVAELGGIDFVVVNQGAMDLYQESWKIPEEDWYATVATNLHGSWLTLKYTIPHVIARGRGGSIVLVSSLAGISPFPYQSAYTASKYGVVGLGLALANELGPHGIRVNVLCPGAIDTPMIDASCEANDLTREQMWSRFEGMDLLEGGPLKPEESTTPTLLHLLSDAARWVTGQVLTVDGGTLVKRK